MDPNNSTPAQTQPVASVEGQTATTPKVESGVASAAQTPTPVTENFTPDQVKAWKEKAEQYEATADFVEMNPDIKRMILERVQGVSKPPVPPIANQQPQGQAAPQTQAPLTAEEATYLKESIRQLEVQRRAEENEREIAEVLQQYPFVNREKLDAAHKREAFNRYQKKLMDGKSQETAQWEAMSEMRALPLDYIVMNNFKTDLQDFLVKTKAQGGVLPPGVGSRGDMVNGGRASFAPGLFEGKVNAYREAKGNIDRQVEVAEALVREMGGDPSDYTVLQNAEAALRTNDMRLINGG